jgi:hypothetical protein
VFGPPNPKVLKAKDTPRPAAIRSSTLYAPRSTLHASSFFSRLTKPHQSLTNISCEHRCSKRRARWTPWIAISSERRLRLHGHGLLAAALKDNEISRKRKRTEEPREHLPPARQAQTLLRLRCGLGCPQQQLQASLELGRTQSSNIEPKHIGFSIARQSAPTPPNREYLQHPFLSSEVESRTHPHCQKEKNMLWNTMGKTTLCIRRTGPSGRSKSSHPISLISRYLLTALQVWNRRHPCLYLSLQHFHLFDLF